MALSKRQGCFTTTTKTEVRKTNRQRRWCARLTTATSAVVVFEEAREYLCCRFRPWGAWLSQTTRLVRAPVTVPRKVEW